MFENQKVEIEIRFGIFRDSKYIPSISHKMFNRVIEWMKSQRITAQISNKTDYSKNRIRKSVDTKTNEVSWMRKEEKYAFISDSYPFKIAVSTEIKEDEQENFIADNIRNKYRRTYLFNTKGYKIDLTEVSTMLNTNERDTKYEIEVELLENTQSNIKELNNISETIFKITRDTYDLYTEEDKKSFLSFVNMTLTNKNNNSYFDMSALSQPRNLKMKDMIYGGLVGHPDITYKATQKADGLRKLLSLHKTGIWIFYSDDLNRISFESLTQYMDINILLANTCFILEGELIPRQSKLKGASEANYWYLSFDCLSVPRTDNKANLIGNRNVQDLSHTARLESAKVLTDMLKNSVIECGVKSFLAFDTATMFFEKMNYLFSEKASLPFKEDGLMFQPEESQYNIGVGRLSLKERSLLRFPETVKWKGKENLTIDLLLEWKIFNDTMYIQLYSWSGSNKVPFNGNQSNPLENRIEVNKLLQDSPSGSVIEFGWNYPNEVLVPRKLREDKLKPNGTEVALDVWEDINDPIEEDLMKGNSMKLMTRYHNSIKRSILEYAKKDLENPTLLDIGSGRGGDVRKWFGFSKIVAVEPNEDNFKELRKRVDGAGLTDRVHLVNTQGENTKAITNAVESFIGTRVDVVSSMLSLSFFWKNETSLKSLFSTIASNISPKGKYVFLTFDGDCAEQIFQPLYSEVELKEIKFGEIARLQYNKDTVPISVDSYMRDSILNYREWLSRTDDLILLFEEYGFELTKHFRADKEKFLTVEEKLFSNFFSYGIFEKTGTETKSVFSFGNLKKELVRVFPIKLNLYQGTTIPKIPTSDIVTFKEPEKSKFTITEIKEEKKRTSLAAIKEEKQIRGNKISVESKMVDRDFLPKFDKKKLEKIRRIDENKNIIPKPFTEIVSGPSKQPPLRRITSNVKQVNNNILSSYSSFEDDNRLTSVKFEKFALVRISCIKDSSSLLHAFCKAVYTLYAEAVDYKVKRTIVKELRRDLSFILSEIDKSSKKERIYYDIINKGSFNALNQNGDIRYSLIELQKRINSNQILGLEVTPILTEILNFDFVFCTVDNDVLVFDRAPLYGNQKRDSVILIRENDYYDLLGLKVQNMIQTFFEHDHKLISLLVK